VYLALQARGGRAIGEVAAAGGGGGGGAEWEIMNIKIFA
jgi:hypothetical protein